jgi:hypothetical protein
MASDEDLIVKPQVLSTYGLHMLTYAAQASIPVTTALSQVEIDSSGAFSGASALLAGVFAEGSVMLAAMAKQQAFFTDFVGDLTKGLMAIGYAADVCAYAYNGTDIESAERMNLLGFAFATDPNAKSPAGLPKKTGETMLDQELKDAASAASQPDVVTNPDGGTTVQVYGSGWQTSYPDGSTKMVETSEVPGDASAGRATTTLTGPNGQVLSVTTAETIYRADGTSSEYYRKVVTPGQKIAGAHGKTTKSPDTTVTTRTGQTIHGDKVIETSEQVGNGKPKVTTVNVPYKAPTPEAKAGPLEEAESVLHAGKVDWRKGYQGVEAQ